MRYMPIEAVTSGMIIGKDIYDANDSILLCQEKRLFRAECDETARTGLCGDLYPG